MATKHQAAWQHQNQQLHTQPKSLGANDKRGQELRLFALAYVQLIVSKAGELQQAHQATLDSHNSVKSKLREASKAIDDKIRLKTGDWQDEKQSRPIQADVGAARLAGPQQRQDHNGETQTRSRAAEYQYNYDSDAHNRHKVNWNYVISCFSTCLPSLFASELRPNLGGHPTTSSPASPSTRHIN